MFGDVFAVPNEAIVDELVARLEELTELAPEVGSLKARDALAWTIGCFTNKWIGLSEVTSYEKSRVKILVNNCIAKYCIA